MAWLLITDFLDMPQARSSDWNPRPRHSCHVFSITVTECSVCTHSFKPHQNLYRGFYCCPHFLDEDIEAQRGQKSRLSITKLLCGPSTML